MIKNKLSEIMGRKRFSMSALARAAGIDYTTIFNLYHNKSKQISFRVIERLCDALDCEVGDLFYFVRDSHDKE